jgi:hypothetical protein
MPCHLQHAGTAERLAVHRRSLPGLLRDVWLAIWLGVQLVPSILAQGQRPPDDTIFRYVVAVDLGAEMKPRMEHVRKTVADLWMTGLSGLARTGDGIALWTFREQVDRSSFPTHIWVSTLSHELATQADSRLQKLRPSKKSLLAGVLGELLQASTQSGVVTGILLTDGSKPVLGTPFDAKINAIFMQNGQAMKEAKRPFALALLARRGAWVAWAVSAGGGKIDIPFIPEDHPAAAGQTDALFNRQPSPKLAAPPPTPKPRPRGAPLIITEPKPVEVVAALPQPTVHPVKPAEPVTPPPAPEPRPAQAPQPKAEPQQAPKPHPAAEVLPAPVPVTEPKPAVQPNLPAAAPSPALPAASTPRHEAAPQEPAAPAPGPQQSAATPAAPSESSPSNTEPQPPQGSAQASDAVATAVVAQTRPMRQLAIALTLLAAAGGLAGLVIRNRRPPPEPSLISQSFDRERR